MKLTTALRVKIFVLITILMGSVITFAKAQTVHNITPADNEFKDSAWDLPLVPNDATVFNFDLKGYVFGLRMIRAQYNGFYTNDSYAVRSKLKTSGLGALLKKLQIWSVTTGIKTPSDLRPVTHVQQNLDKKNRRVEIGYDYEIDSITVKINPRLGSQGKPPASPIERFSADDTLSAVLNLMMRGGALAGEVCKGSIRVFDSKQHYNLRMEQAGTKKIRYHGKKHQTLRCQLYYEPISGFDPEDLPNDKEQSTPVKVYYLQDAHSGLYVPIRFTYAISGFKAVIKVNDMEIGGQRVF